MNMSNLTNLRFANDILILAKSQEELREMKNILMEKFNDARLELNTKTSRF